MRAWQSKILHFSSIFVAILPRRLVLMEYFAQDVRRKLIQICNTSGIHSPDSVFIPTRYMYHYFFIRIHFIWWLTRWLSGLLHQSNKTMLYMSVWPYSRARDCKYIFISGRGNSVLPTTKLHQKWSLLFSYIFSFILEKFPPICSSCQSEFANWQLSPNFSKDMKLIFL